MSKPRSLWTILPLFYLSIQLLASCGGEESSPWLQVSSSNTSNSNDSNNSLVNTTLPEVPTVSLIITEPFVENDSHAQTLQAIQQSTQTHNWSFYHEVIESNIHDSLEKRILNGDVLILISTQDPARANWENISQLSQHYPNIHLVTLGYTYENYEQLPNITSLTFSTAEAGFLAGALAGCMTQTQIIGNIIALETPSFTGYGTGFQAGARYANPFVTVLNETVGALDAPLLGQQYAEALIRQGADLIFAVGGNTADGALEAASQFKIKVIGAEVDQYLLQPDLVKHYLLTSAIEHRTSAIEQTITNFNQGQLENGVLNFTLADKAIDLAPYHEWADRIPWNCKQKIQQAQEFILETPSP